MGKKIVHVEFPAKDADRGREVLGRPRRLVDRERRAWKGWTTGCSRTTAGAAPSTRSRRASGGTTIYFGSDDIDADLAKVRELGGEAEDKKPIPHVGWFARCKDTEGNSFSLFQSDESVAPPQ